VTHRDTSFLVDLLRENSRSRSGPATALLARLGEEELRVGLHVVCELLAGAEMAPRPSTERQRVHDLCGSLKVVYSDQRVPAILARLLATLERARQRIATMDLLIATAALVDAALLVTWNTGDFPRVPGLELVGY
jgi:predicted nucleic acid-binding protein